jgi:chemotaxis protein CheD
MANKLTVGVADMKVSKKPNDVIVTHALGSCIGIALYDPIVKVGGMLHFMLPSSKDNEQKAQANPYIYADTGIPLLFKKMYTLGAQKNKIIVKVAGGAQILDDSNFFAIGKRNYLIMKKILWKNQVLIESEDVGKNHYRTLFLDVGTGKTWIKTKNGEHEL